MKSGLDPRDARRVVARATVVLMNRHHITDSEAFRWLQRIAVKRRSSLLVVADAVIGTESRATESPARSLPAPRS